MAANKLKFQSFRTNDLVNDGGKQFELGKSWCDDFFEFDKTLPEVVVNLKFKAIQAGHVSLNDKIIELKLADVSTRGDRKAYVNGNNGMSQIKDFFINDLHLTPDNNLTDYFAIYKVSEFDYFLYFVPSILYKNFLQFFRSVLPTVSVNHDKEYLETDVKNSLQQIFYGAPGTGKSHKIKDDESVKAAAEKNLVFRTTFHPDSDYSTFVGAYKPTTMDVQVTTLIGKEAVPVKNADGTPKTEKKIIYEFVPQAFLQAYVAAWNNPDENVYLVIEEINRGNCAQIFGDLFQLLDRDDNGESEYPIMADRDLAKYLSGKDEEDENSKGALSNKEGIKDGKLKLPKNLYIWATMNTSDQSLFPIDSAFKRRWDWEYMPIGYKNNTWTIKIGTKEYNWVDFQTEINKKIYGIDNSEDKQLGDYFVNADRTGNEISSDTLLNKILFYLWNDVCKDDPDIIFKWVDDKDNNKEKSIKFSEFFCEKAEKERKLQGFMAFLEINVKTNEEADEPNDDNSDKDGKEFSYNGTAASMREIAAFVVSDYAKTNSGMNAQQVRDYFIETFKGIGIAHIVETESEYRKRDGQSSQERTVKSVTIPNGEIIYVSTQWRAGKESDNFYQFMKIVNEKGLGTINSL
ncbi:McrB family protein [Prevotella sp. Rep29]|uniref:McrB family protein n=1 Tax=Prevotella sp. Rep29 TaxID=2691580 RepID=UPI001C6F2772|nr:hypothetical protein [Prevotella sp. Rep29]QYR11492.1 hypothetical protein GRF55_10565 [Prevotella sp. Rep29]